MYDSVIDLINGVYTVSTATGIPTATETSRTVYAHVESISRSEWYEAGNAGFKPEFRFRLPRSSYAGELALNFGGVRYSIYRTFTEKGEIELYAQKATGETYGG